MPCWLHHIFRRSWRWPWGSKSILCCLFEILIILSARPFLMPALCHLKELIMDTPPGPKYSPSPVPFDAEARPGPGLDPRVSIKSHTSKLDMCCSGLDVHKTGFLELVSKRKRDARAVSIANVADAARPAQSSYIQREQLASPLRLALARRSIRNQIFTYMDHGDKKTDIESRTGLSHRCIKRHRQMWRAESKHPRIRSSKVSKKSVRTPRPPSTRNERSLMKRPADDEERDCSDVSKPSGSRRQRKKCAVKAAKERSAHTAMEMSGSRGRGCTERKTRESSLFSGKESMQERDKALLIPGALTTLPVRQLRS